MVQRSSPSGLLAGKMSEDEFDMEEGEEEPLFADDLEDDDDDPPPLPPPMPSLSQLNSRQQSWVGQGGSGSGSGSGAAGGQGDVGSASGAADNQTLPPLPQPTDQGPPLKKRKPILTLKVDRIFSDKGLPYLESEFPKLKFKGKGHEVSDLNFLMKQYEHWGNRLFPKYTFKDLTQRIERLSTTKEFKNELLRIRRRHARGGQATPPLVDSDDELPPPTAPPDSNDVPPESHGGLETPPDNNDGQDLVGTPPESIGGLGTPPDSYSGLGTPPESTDGQADAPPESNDSRVLSMVESSGVPSPAGSHHEASLHSSCSPVEDSRISSDSGVGYTELEGNGASNSPNDTLSYRDSGSNNDQLMSIAGEVDEGSYESLHNEEEN